MKRIVVLLLAFAFGLGLAPRPDAAPPASAHALLVRADPPVNAQLREAPSELTLYFSEALEPEISTARVINAAGERVDTSLEFDDQDDALMRVALAPLEPGYVTVIWETLSQVDGHRITGSYPLTILNPDGSLPPGQPSAAAGGTLEGTDADPGRVVTKWLLLVAGSVLAGALAFAVWVLPGLATEAGERTRAGLLPLAVAAAAVSLVVLAAAGVVDLLFQSAEVASFGEVGRVINDTRWGERWLYRNLLLLPVAPLLGTVWLRRDRAGGAGPVLLLGLVLVLGYLALSASSSHGAAGEGSFWGIVGDFVHLVAASVWLGLLACLGFLVYWTRRRLGRRERAPVVAAALGRFSVVAVVSIALLLFSGVVNAVIEIARFRDLVETGYGRALALKLLLLLPLLAAGGANAYYFRPRLTAPDEEAADRRYRGSLAWGRLETRLARTLRWELALGVIVLAVVAVLVQLTPSRSALSGPTQSAGKFVDSKSDDGLSVTLVVDPNEPGFNTFETYLAGGVDVVERVRLLFETAGGEFSRSALVLDASNPPTFYVGRGPYLAEAGEWQVTVDIRRRAPASSDLAIPFTVAVAEVGSVATAGDRGGAFDLPRPLSTGVVALVAVSGAFALAILVGSLPAPGRPAGRLGALADEVAYYSPRPSLSLAALLLVGVGLGILLGSHAHNILTKEQASARNPVEASADSIERGRALFVQNCIRCHGESGRGDGPLAASLPIPPANLYDHIPYHPDEFFFSVITDGLSGVMPAFSSQLSVEERWDILNFLRDQFGEQGAAAGP